MLETCGQWGIFSKGDFSGRVSGERRGYPVAEGPGCRPHNTPRFRTAFGRFFRSGQMNPESLAETQGIQVLGDDPLTRIGDHIRQL